jgi:hypothetical protein
MLYVGSENGSVATELATRGFKVTGIDMAEAGIHIAGMLHHGARTHDLQEPSWRHAAAGTPCARWPFRLYACFGGLRRSACFSAT